MISKSEQDIREALEHILDLYGIELDESPAEPEKGDYSEVISKTQAKLDELNEKAEEIFQKTNMTREQLDAYAANPANFTPEQWEALQKVKEACERYKRDALSRIEEVMPQEKAEEAPQKKKQTHRFAKKKNWIPL